MSFISLGVPFLPMPGPLVGAGCFLSLLGDKSTGTGRCEARWSRENRPVSFDASSKEIGVNGRTHSPLTTHCVDPTMPERLYIVLDDPQAPENHLVLENGDAVICSVTDEAAALATIASDRGLSVRRHTELSRTDQRRVTNALNRTS